MLIDEEAALGVWLPILYDSLVLFVMVLGVWTMSYFMVFYLFFSFYFDRCFYP